MSAFPKWSPVTRDFGLIEAAPGAIRDVYTPWWTSLGIPVDSCACPGPIEAQFAALTPLSSALNRTLLLPTVSGWTAFFRNGIQGSDPASAIPILSERLDVRAMRICSTGPNTSYPAVIWEFYDPKGLKDGGNICLRSIAVANDGGRWVFETCGTPFPFERLDRYDARRKQDRFDHALLMEYLGHFGIDRLDDELFSDPSGGDGILITRPLPANHRGFTLAETVAGLPWQR